MARTFLRIMQVATVIMLFSALVFVASAFETNTWKLDSLSKILNALKNLLSCVFYGVMALSSLFVGSVFMANSYIYHLNDVSEVLLFQFLNMTFRLTDTTGSVVTFRSWNDMGSGIGDLIAGHAVEIATNGYFLLFLVLIILAFIYILLFIARSDIKYSIYSTLSTSGLFIVASFPALIQRILEFFGVPLTSYQWIFDEYFPGTTITNPAMSAQSFTAGAFWAAFFIYACIEMSFQTAYTAKVTQPSIERQRRLEGQISLLGEKSLQFELEKQRSMREQKQLSVEGKKGEEEEKKRITLKSFFTGAGIDAIRDLIERRERTRERERLEEVSSDTRRLNTYITRLFEINVEARESLTAIGSAPSQKRMVTSTFLNMGLRLGALIGLVVVVTNPILLYQVFNVPPIISESFDITAPEAVITALVPIALLFPLVSFIIRTYKQYKLTQVRMQKEQQSAMLKRLSDLREIEEEETVIDKKETDAAKVDKT
nr:hypothetical protein [Candidatus Sigynarchaeota archaeon]